MDPEVIKHYLLYKKHVEETDYDMHNRSMNSDLPKYGTIKPSGMMESLRFQALYMDAARLSILTREERPFIDKLDSIINQIKELKIEKEYMNSRCYPTGIAMEGNIMILGEAPGVKGRAIQENWLKPSFVFTRTSWILRRALMSTFKIAPYLTNACKFACEKNIVKNHDFDKCIHILKQEIDLIKPKKVVVLGNNAYNYFRNNFSIECVKVMHPSATLYMGMSFEDYLKLWKHASID